MARKLKVVISLFSKKGFYAQSEARAATLVEALAKIIPALEKMPDQIDGVQQFDCKRLIVEVTNEEKL